MHSWITNHTSKTYIFPTLRMHAYHIATKKNSTLRAEYSKVTKETLHR